jgi:hypothetical protein
MDRFQHNDIDRRPAGPRAAATLALAALVAWTAPVRGEQVQVYGRIANIGVFNTTTARPRLDANETVEFTLSVERTISQDVAEDVGRTLTLHLPLEEAVLRDDVADLHVGDSTYVTITVGSPVQHFRFHPAPEQPGSAAVGQPAATGGSDGPGQR